VSTNEGKQGGVSRLDLTPKRTAFSGDNERRTYSAMSGCVAGCGVSVLGSVASRGGCIPVDDDGERGELSLNARAQHMRRCKLKP
jgi:hypothetical protein